MLDSLHIKNFRCFEDLTIPSLGRVNLIVGKNNSGKSTLLDTVYLYAKNGNAKAIAAILSNRNDFFYNKKDRRSAFNNFKKIFGIKSEHVPALIEGKNKNIRNFISIQYANDLSSIMPKIPALYGKTNIDKFLFKDKEGFIIKENNKENYVTIQPDNIFDHIDEILPILTKKPVYIALTERIKENQISKLWGKAQKKAEDDIILNILKIIEPRIIKLFFEDEETEDNDYKKIGYITLSNPTQVRTLKSMGDGLSILLRFALAAFEARGGFLLIDEFENGLHYSIQEEVWEKLFKLAKELDIQVFATTHSEDTVKAFSKVALRSPEEGQIIYLARHMREQDPDKGKISAIVYNENDLEMILQTGMEVR